MTMHEEQYEHEHGVSEDISKEALLDISTVELMETADREALVFTEETAQEMHNLNSLDLDNDIFEQIKKETEIEALLRSFDDEAMLICEIAKTDAEKAFYFGVEDFVEIKAGQLSSEEKKIIEEKTNQKVLGGGADSIVFKGVNGKALGVNYSNKKVDNDLQMLYKQNPEKAYEILKERTFDQKSRYYSNKILTTLFPNNFAKLHSATAGISISEEIQNKLKSAHPDMPDNISQYRTDEREFVSKAAFYNAWRYLPSKSTVSDALDSLSLHGIHLFHDRSDHNTLKDTGGNEVYIDNSYLNLKLNSGTVQTVFGDDDIEKLIGFMNTENTRRANTYTQGDIDSVRTSAERLKIITEEYKKPDTVPSSA